MHASLVMVAKRISAGILGVCVGKNASGHDCEYLRNSAGSSQMTAELW